MSAATAFDRRHDPFFKVPQTQNEISIGRVPLPILYYDASNFIAFFRAPTTAAAALLDGTGLKPAYNLLGATVVGLSFFEYRDTSVGAYNEVGFCTGLALFRPTLHDVECLQALLEQDIISCENPEPTA